MRNPEQLCNICDSPLINFEGMPCGDLVSNRLYAGVGYKVALCGGCFMQCLANLRRDRLVHTMFYEFDEDLGNFGRVSASELSRDNEAALTALMDALVRDIETHPELLVPIAKELVTRIEALVGQCDVDLNAPLPHDH
jgi:hypothetical protein